MDLNVLGILFLSGLAYYTYTIPKKQEIIPWNIQDNKSRSFVNKNKDASLYTELKRRQAIQTVGRLNFSKIKETKTQKGSTTGYLESFLITGICDPLPDTIYDGGNPNNEFCPVPETNTLDAGNENTKACGI